jgi:predicted nucleotidyltransferase
MTLRQCWRGVVISFLDRSQRIQDLQRCGAALKEARPEVAAVWLFGSLASARAVPDSDIDLLILLHHHEIPRWFDRIPDYLVWFADFPCDVDLFPLTRQEAATSLLAQKARRSGMRLA